MLGAQRMVRELGLPDLQVRSVPADRVAAGAVIRAWQSLPNPVTAVCAYNDEVAVALLAGATEVGVKVPAELALIGVDDIPTARLTVPALTTVTHNFAALAERVALTVVNALAGKPAPRRWSVAAEVLLISRESV